MALSTLYLNSINIQQLLNTNFAPVIAYRDDKQPFQITRAITLSHNFQSHFSMIQHSQFTTTYLIDGVLEVSFPNALAYFRFWQSKNGNPLVPQATAIAKRIQLATPPEHHQSLLKIQSLRKQFYQSTWKQRDFIKDKVAGIEASCVMAPYENDYLFRQSLIEWLFQMLGEHPTNTTELLSWLSKVQDSDNLLKDPFLCDDNNSQIVMHNIRNYLDQVADLEITDYIENVSQYLFDQNDPQWAIIQETIAEVKLETNRSLCENFSLYLYKRLMLQNLLTYLLNPFDMTFLSPDRFTVCALPFKLGSLQSFLVRLKNKGIFDTKAARHFQTNPMFLEATGCTQAWWDRLVNSIEHA